MNRGEVDDINDIFNDIVSIEENCVRAGYEEGFAEGSKQGNEEGYKLGYEQGVQLGQELGEIYGTVLALEQQSHTEKVTRTLRHLRECIDKFPSTNEPDADIIGELENIRTLQRKLNAMQSGSKKANNESIKKPERKDYSF